MANSCGVTLLQDAMENLGIVAAIALPLLCGKLEYNVVVEANKGVGYRLSRWAAKFFCPLALVCGHHHCPPGGAVYKAQSISCVLPWGYAVPIILKDNQGLFTCHVLVNLVCNPFDVQLLLNPQRDIIHLLLCFFFRISGSIVVHDPTQETCGLFLARVASHQLSYDV